MSDLIQLDGAATRTLASRLLAAGDVIAYLTDTFYGLGANPFDERALEKLVHLKGREENKPILVIISDLEIADKFLLPRSDDFHRLAERFWSGQLTIVEKAKPRVMNRLKSSSGAIGLRLPGASEVRRLVRACGGALTGTSANPAGCRPAISAREVAAYFPTGLSLIVDGGDATQTQPSTVVDVSGGQTRLLREGLISRSEIASVVTLH